MPWFPDEGSSAGTIAPLCFVAWDYGHGRPFSTSPDRTAGRCGVCTRDGKILSAWRDKKLKGLFVGATGSAGNASTRLEAFATARGVLSYGSIAEVETLFAAQLQEMDRKKREEMLHQIQKIVHERVMFAPIWENGFIRAVGPRVDEAALSLIPAFPYSAPLEDLRLKK